MNSKRFRLWDLPTRIFHWSLVLCVVAAVVTGQLGGNLIDWHGKIGLAIVGLIVFRLLWGFLGSTYARFVQFFPTPAKVRAYLTGQWHGEGHNPIGAFSVFGLLGLLALQVTTGLFSNDDIAFSGPFSDLVGKDWSDRLTGLHHLLADGLIILVGLHVAAILFYVHVKKNNLLKPMLSGEKEGDAPSAQGGGVLAFLVAVAIALAVVYAASGACLPAAPPPPSTVPAPNW